MNSRFSPKPDLTILVPVMIALFALACMVLSTVLPASIDPHVKEGMASFGMFTGVVGAVWLVVVLVKLSFRLVWVFVDEELVVKQWMLFDEKTDWASMARVIVDGCNVHLRSSSRELMLINLKMYDDAVAERLLFRLQNMARLHGVPFAYAQ